MDNSSDRSSTSIILQPVALLSFIFLLSGFSALIYQVVWQRLLTIHYGVGAISITLIVSVYMVGLGVGGLVGGYLAERVNNKIFLYCFIEFLIGLFGLISLPLLDFIGSITAGSDHVFSFFYMFLFLCIPTFLMGMTLPLVTKIFNRLVHDFLNTVSFLYFINTIGAAIGTIFASHVIISFFGLDSAILVAVCINFTLAILIFFVRSSSDIDTSKINYSAETIDDNAIFGTKAYLLVFITGFFAIGYEIIWFRIIGVLTKASPYAFSSILFIYLTGIAFGSLGTNYYLKHRKVEDKKSLFYLLQFLIGLSVITTFLGFYYLTKYTPFEVLTISSFKNELHPAFGIPSLSSIKQFFIDLYTLTDVFWWAAFFMLLPTFFMGASFPLINLLALKQQNNEGGTVGTVYFFNIGGNVVGGMATGFLFLPFLGTELTVLIFSSAGLLFGIFVSYLGTKYVPLNYRIICVSVLILSALLFSPREGKFYQLIHHLPGQFKGEYGTSFAEGVEGVVVTKYQQAKIITYINGLAHGGRPGYLFYFETLEALKHVQRPENALVIGFGTGSITEMILQSRKVKNLTLVELNKTLLKNLTQLQVFNNILSNSRLNTILDDGRRYLIRTEKLFDFVAIDPLRTTTAYSNNLYSKQFFQLVHDHLDKDGIFLVWTDGNTVISNTVNSVFNYVRVYGYFTLASKSPFNRDSDRVRDIIAQHSRFSLQRIFSTGKQYGQFIGDQDYLTNKKMNSKINEDWKPVAEYYLGLKIREHKSFQNSM